MALNQENLDEFLDQSVQDNVKILPDFLNALKSEQKSLENQLSGRSGTDSGESASEWEKVARDVHGTIGELEAVRERCGAILEETGTSSASSDSQFLPKETVQFARKLRDKVTELTRMEKLLKYLQWLKKTKEICVLIKEKVATGAMDQAIELFQELASLANSLKSSHCQHLKQYVEGACEEWKEILKEKLSREFSELLKVMGWPVTGAHSMASIVSNEQKKERFSLCFRHLLALDCYHQINKTPFVKIHDPIFLPLELMLSPLRKRFKYHFYGDRKTNSKEKPEWFFTQVTTWIDGHASFLNDFVQPALQDSRFAHISAKVEFCRGLLQEVIAKLQYEFNPSSLPEGECCILDDDYLMSHLIDEILLFDNELRNVHGYPKLYESAVVVLLEEGPLCRWLNLEKHFTVEKLKKIMESPTAWQNQYLAVMDEDDEMRAPECAEKFMQLVAGITERYRQIPVLFPKLRFLELQIDLMHEFLQDLISAVEQLYHSPHSAQFILYLNAVNYINVILRGWTEQTFFLELHYYFNHISHSHATDIKQTLKSIETLRKTDPDYARLEGTAFETVIIAFRTLAEEMVECIVKHFVGILRLKCQTLSKQKWHNLPLISDPIMLEISPSALGLLVTLQEQLHLISSSVSPALHSFLFNSFTDEVDKMILVEVMYANHFNEGGASQLFFDINKAISPLLAQYTNTDSDSLMKHCREACLLLQQPTSSLEALQHLLKSGLQGDKESYSLAMSTLTSIGIHFMSVENADVVLKLRIFT